MIFCGLVGATIAGLLIDYTKKFKEITVITLSLAILCLIWFMEVSIKAGSQYDAAPCIVLVCETQKFLIKDFGNFMAIRWKNTMQRT